MSTLNQIKVEDTLYDIEDKEARKELLKKIDKVEGKGLSTNDFTNEHKEKLDSLSNSNDELFMVNITIEGTQYVADKTYNEVLQAYNEGKIVQCTIEVDGTKMVLPLCNINEENSYLVYGGAAEIITIAVIHNNNGYIHLTTRMLATQEELANKQDNLISGQNIKTINGEDILGVGNIEIQGGTGGSNEWRLIGEITTAEEVDVIQIVSDTLLNEMIAYVSVPPITTDTVADTGGTIYLRPVLKNQKSINVNVGLNKPSTSAQRELWHITRNWCIRQYWKGSGATQGVLSGATEEAFNKITEDYNNEGGLLGFDLTWNTSHKFPVGVIMKVWGR
jgi:hypothetical protein